MGVGGGGGLTGHFEVGQRPFFVPLIFGTPEPPLHNEVASQRKHRAPADDEEDGVAIGNAGDDRKNDEHDEEPDHTEHRPSLPDR